MGSDPALQCQRLLALGPVDIHRSHIMVPTKNSIDAKKTYGCRGMATCTRCRGLWNSAYSKVRRPKITRSMPPTPYGCELPFHAPWFFKGLAECLYN